MRIAAIIVTLIGLLITGISSLGIVVSLYTATEAAKSSAAGGIGTFAAWVSYAQILSYVNLFGLVILFFGVVLLIVTMFMGRKK
jgi:hypothetical protein